jgi:hypothetical protein
VAPAERTAAEGADVRNSAARMLEIIGVVAVLYGAVTALSADGLMATLGQCAVTAGASLFVFGRLVRR